VKCIEATNCLLLSVLLLAADTNAAPPIGQPLPAGGLRQEHGAFSMVAGADVNAYAYAMRGTWWGLAEASAPDFDTDIAYLELWLHPRLNVTYALGDDSRLYAGLSAGITRDVNENAFGYEDQGAEKLENAFLGYAFGSKESWHLDVSGGRQPFVLGSGMLIYAGALNGNEWGNAASAKRVAWRNTAIARLGHGSVTGQLFWLDPHEVPSAESKTRLAGASLEWSDATHGKAGFGYIHVPRSEFGYPGDLAPFAFIEDGRDGLETYHGWSDLQGIVSALPALAVRAEFAIQRGEIQRIQGPRDDLEAFAAYLGASYWWQQAPFAPKLTYGFAWFSGDDPDTSTYERFDPLYWGNGLDNWWFGANGAYSFINSNVQFQRLTLDAFASERDIFKLQYVRASAVERNSPIQFGQSVRFDPGSTVPTVGVDDRHLSDEIALQYVRTFGPTVAVSAYVTHSIPGAGIEDITASGGEAWTSVGLGITASF